MSTGFQEHSTAIANRSDRALCALYAIQDATAENEVLRDHPVIERWGGTIPAVVLYAFIRRANQDADPIFESNATSFFRADQIQAALALLGREGSRTERQLCSHLDMLQLRAQRT